MTIIGIKLEQSVHGLKFRVVAYYIENNTQLTNNKIVHVCEGNNIQYLISSTIHLCNNHLSHNTHFVIIGEEDDLVCVPESSSLLECIEYEYRNFIKQANDEFVDWNSIDWTKDIDWTKIPIGTLVIVSDSDSSQYTRKRYVGVNYSSNFPYICLADADQSKCNYSRPNKMSLWTICKIHHSVNIKKEWLK